MFTELIKKYNNVSVQAKASFWALICGILSKGIQIITTPVFTRLLSTAEFGQYNVFNSWMQILTIVISLSLSAGVFQQGLVKFEEDSKKYTSSMQGLSFTLTVLWLIVYLVFRNTWNKLLSLTTEQMLLMIALIWLSSVFGFWLAEQRNDYKYKALVAVTFTASLLSPVTSIILIRISEDKVTARILGSFAVAFLIYVPLFFIQLKKGKSFFASDYWKDALSLNLPLVPHYLSQVVLNSSDRIMIERMAGDSFAGIYGLAYSLSMVMTIINNALHQTLSPWFYRKIKENQISDISKVAYPSMIGVAAVNIILILFAPEAVRIFAPSAYFDAIWIIPPVAISVFYMFSYDMFAKFAFYYEKTFFITVASIAGATLNILLNFIFIRKFGYIAAGYTTLLCYIVYTAGHYIFMNKVCDKFCNGVRPYNTKIIILISSAFTVSGLLLLLTYNHFVVRYSMFIVVIVIAIILRNRITEIARRIFNLKKV